VHAGTTRTAVFLTAHTETKAHAKRCATVGRGCSLRFSSLHIHHHLHTLADFFVRFFGANPPSLQIRSYIGYEKGKLQLAGYRKNSLLFARTTVSSCRGCDSIDCECKIHKMSNSPAKRDKNYLGIKTKTITKTTNDKSKYSPLFGSIRQKSNSHNDLQSVQMTDDIDNDQIENFPSPSPSSPSLSYNKSNKNKESSIVHADSNNALQKLKQNQQPSQPQQFPSFKEDEDEDDDTEGEELHLLSSSDNNQGHYNKNKLESFPNRLSNNKNKSYFREISSWLHWTSFNKTHKYK